VLAELLRERAAEHRVTISNAPLADRLPRSGSYLYIGSGMSLTRQELDSIEAFVRRGNVAMFITEYVSPRMVCRTLGECGIDDVTDGWAARQATLGLSDFADSTMPTVSYANREGPATYMWDYLVGDVAWDVVGTLADSLPNFAEKRVGDGVVYIHTTPLAFTNYALLNRDMLDYDQKVLSYLPDDDIYWDRAQRRGPDDDDDDHNRKDIGGSESTFGFILSQPPLRWAWYLLIGMAVLFVVFRAKRSQRMIPVMEQNTNTSLEFVRTIGQLYRLQGDHKKMAEMQMGQFLAHARDHYRVPTQDDEVEMQLRIAAKSQVPVKQINRIFAMYRTLSRQDSVSADDLTQFHTLLQDFYMNAK
jgi:hypothetical protein